MSDGAGCHQGRNGDEDEAIELDACVEPSDERKKQVETRGGLKEKKGE